MEQLCSLRGDAVVVLFDAAGFDVEEVFFGDLLRGAGEEGAEVRFAVELAHYEEGRETVVSTGGRGRGKEWDARRSKWN